MAVVVILIVLVTLAIYLRTNQGAYDKAAYHRAHRYSPKENNGTR